LAARDTTRDTSRETGRDTAHDEPELYRDEVCSPCGEYRYYATYKSLERRRWASADRLAVVVGCNPTPRDGAGQRCWAFARAWECPTVVLLNLFAFRADSRRRLLSVEDPIGPQNRDWLLTYLAQADVCVAAWGDLSAWFRGLTRRSLGRAARCVGHVRSVLAGVSGWQCLGLTRNRSPVYPLFRPAHEPLRAFVRGPASSPWRSAPC